MKKLILILIVITAIAVSCKKYPDGPWISFRSAENRLLGTYNLTQYTVNGVDSLNILNDSIPFTLALSYDQGDNVNRGYAKWYSGNGKYTEIISEWSLRNNKKEIIFTYTFGPQNCCNTWYNFTYTILKLTDKETEWKATYNGKEYFIALKKQ